MTILITLAVITNQRARAAHGVYARERDGFGVRFWTLIIVSAGRGRSAQRTLR